MLNSIKKISKGLIDSDVIHDKVTLVIKEYQNYFWLKERIREKDQLSDNECNRLIEHDKSIGQIERLSLELKTDT